jgi:cytochrome c
MKSIVIATFVCVGMAVAGTANAQEALAKSSGCMNCHDIGTKKIGPSFKEIAAKNKGKAGADVAWGAKLAAGKDHPEVKAKGDDLKSLVKWILSQ